MRMWTAAAIAALIGTTAQAAPQDAEHAALARLTGHWSVRQSVWTSPGKPPAIDAGEADFAMVLDGRHLRQTLRIAAKGKPFEGLGYIGYDDGAKAFFSTWMDINFTGLIVARGGYDPAARRYAFTGVGPDGAPLREVMTVQDDDHFTYDYFETHGGKESQAVRLEYVRAG